MKYVLILKNGKVMTFFVKAVAETYHIAYGGTLITDELYATAYSELLVE
jgi:hypothetical protein